LFGVVAETFLRSTCLASDISSYFTMSTFGRHVTIFNCRSEHSIKRVDWVTSCSIVFRFSLHLFAFV
jgi:hypothetical protein